MTTTLTAAARWTGERFDMDDTPMWLLEALGPRKITFNGENLGVETNEGPVSAAPGDWVLVFPDDGGLGIATDEDFHANYEIAE